MVFSLSLFIVQLSSLSDVVDQNEESVLLKYSSNVFLESLIGNWSFYHWSRLIYIDDRVERSIHLLVHSPIFLIQLFIWTNDHKVSLTSKWSTTQEYLNVHCSSRIWEQRWWLTTLVMSFKTLSSSSLFVQKLNFN